MNAPKLPVHAEAGVVIGGYELVRRIGRGGMAEVWVARRALGRKGSKFVAIKLIADHHIGEERYSRMFKAEAELAAVLSHANIVQVFDEGEDHGRSFLVMEWVDGLNLLKLGAVLALLDDSERRFRVTSYIIGQLLYALKYAHSITSFDGSPLGIVHRDVSPQNVLISNHGEVKLTDFGVAYYAMEESSGLHVKGKVRYMSPEQLSGKTRSPTVDLYAVGALLHELLDGKKFRSEYEGGQEMFNAVLQGALPPLTRNAPPELDELRLRLLQPDPADRIQSAEEALEWLKLYPAYGDARDELTKLCSGLTGIVRPRVGPGRSAGHRAASRSPGLARPRVNLRPAPSAVPRAPAPAPTPAPGVRTTSTTAVKGRPDAPEVPPILSGGTELVDPRRHEHPPAVPSPLPALPSSPLGISVAPGAIAQHVAPQGSSPIPHHVAPSGSPPHPHTIASAGARRSAHITPTQPLGYSERPGLGPTATEMLDPNMILEIGPGSGTEQEIAAPTAIRDDTDTSRDVRIGSSVNSHPIHVRRRSRATVPLVVLGLVAVALVSVTLTWWLFTIKDRSRDAVTSAASPAYAGEREPRSSTRDDEPASRSPGRDDSRPSDPSATSPTAPEPSGTDREPRDVPEPTPRLEDTAPEDGAADNGATADAAVEHEVTEIGTTEDDETEHHSDAPVPELPSETTDSSEHPPEPDPKVKPKKAVVVVKGLPGMEGAQVKIGSTILTIPPVSRSIQRRLPPGRRKIAWRPDPAAPWRPSDSAILRSGRVTNLLLSSTRGVQER